MELDRLNVRDFFEEAVSDVPDQPFLVWQDEPVTYRTFDTRVNRAANAWHRLGVRKGDRVVFMADNSPEFLEAWLGLVKVGGVLSAVNTGFKADEVAHQVEHSDPRCILVSDQHGEVMASVSDRLPSIPVLHLGPHDRFRDFRVLLAEAGPDAPPVELVGDDPISLIYTSGTTGRPKAVVQTHRTFVLTGQAYPSWLDIRRGDRQYVCLPYFHINSQAYSTMGAIGARSTIVLAPRFSASRFWPEVRRHGVTHFNFIGAMTVILSRRDASVDDIDNQVRVAYGGTKLPYDLQMDVERRFGLRIISGFGMSETTFGMIEDVHGYRRPGSIGKPRQHPDPAVPRNEARLIDDQGQDVAPGEVGELILRNPAMALGYFRDPERTAEAFRDGWLHTGDLLRRDEEGFHFFVDRKKDVIRRRGENVSSVEVERILAEHPSVQYASVVGVPSELTDEEILAWIVPRPGATVDPAALLAWAGERLAAFKVPRYVRVIDELPRTGSHKVRKELLREGWQGPGLHDRETRDEADTGGGAA
jgi:carnitine-CoA ligase